MFSKNREKLPENMQAKRKLDIFTSRPAVMFIMILVSTFIISGALVLNIKGTIQVAANPCLQGFVIANLLYDSVCIALYPAAGLYNTIRVALVLKQAEKKGIYILLHIFYICTYAMVLYVIHILPDILDTVI